MKKKVILMLDPHSRYLYLDCLRPPEGYILDRTIGTTFSLDLLSLLMAPLSMTYYDCQNKDDLLKNPVALLEALNETTDKMALFCQRGHISIPTNDSLLYSYLEPVVVEVQPYDKNGVFHPKVWLLRFCKKNKNEDEVLYRFLCLSRNLTFDNSWDTALILEGKLKKSRKNAFSRNRPLSDFIAALPSMAIEEINTKVKEHIDIISDEVLRVDFEAPESYGFNDEIRFIPLGINGYTKPPKFNVPSRFLAMSPFLSEKPLCSQFQYGCNNILISRDESLNGLDDATYEKIKSNSTIYTVDEFANHLDDVESEVTKTSEGSLPDHISGLHAKLYLSEEGWNARLLTGSANLTNAAFHGKNIEFLVELTGKRSRIGIEKILSENEDGTSFHSLLTEYVRPKDPIDTDEVRIKLENALEKARRTLSMASLSIMISKNSDDTYLMKLKSDNCFSFEYLNLSGRCYPITLNDSGFKDIAPLKDRNCVVFERTSLESLTGFFAFELTADCENQSLSTSFVLNLPIDGLPSNRKKSILQSIIKDKNGFIRYLFFLLADDDQYKLLQTIQNNNKGDTATSTQNTQVLPLLEELVRAYSRHPEKIDRIAQLVEDLNESDQSTELFPEGFDVIWKAFTEACTGRHSH